MVRRQTDPVEETEDTDDDAAGVERLTTLIEQVVGNTIGKLLDSGKVDVREGGAPQSKRAQNEGNDIEGQVAKAVQAAQEQERRTAAEKTRDDKIAELQAKLDAKEKTPREFRPIHKVMGWVRDGDE